MTKSDSGSAPIDTSDMLAVHGVFRRSLASAPDFVASAQGDDARRAMMANYYANLMSFLEAHHDGEEKLVFPLLSERAPGQMALIDEATSQHHEVVGRIDACTAYIGEWENTGDAGSAQLVQALAELEAALNPHLSQEEAEILPLANAHIAAEEWGMLPGHAMQHFTGDKIWLILGLIRENMTQQQRDNMLAHMPPPPREMWQNMGEDAFNALIAEVRQTT